MADTDDFDELDDAEDADGDDEESLDEPSGGGKKRLFILLGVALLLVVGGIGAAYATGMLDKLIAMIGGAEEVAEDEPIPTADVVFFDLPEFLVNLNTSGRKSTFLKLRVSLELNRQSDIPHLQEIMPRIVDSFQVYLREMRVEDLKGSAGIYRLREELLTRVSAAVAPARVNDVLFKEMLVQ